MQMDHGGIPLCLLVTQKSIIVFPGYYPSIVGVTDLRATFIYLWLTGSLPTSLQVPVGMHNNAAYSFIIIAYSAVSCYFPHSSEKSGIAYYNDFFSSIVCLFVWFSSGVSGEVFHILYQWSLVYNYCHVVKREEQLCLLL